jgi:endoglucanase
MARFQSVFVLSRVNEPDSHLSAERHAAQGIAPQTPPLFRHRDLRAMTERAYPTELLKRQRTRKMANDAAWVILLRKPAVVICVMVAVSIISSSREARTADQNDAFYYNRLLGQGINLGNALEAPVEGAWGVTLRPEYFQIIKDAGFNAVRIPIRWSAHAETLPPYSIDAAFFDRVDWAINQALSRALVAVIDVHHFVEMDSTPLETLPRLIAIWTQIAQHYSGYSDRLFFELLNEPHDQLTAEVWQSLLPILLRAVRVSNPKRIVLIGLVPWNDISHLDELRLPEDDRRLIVTFHYYNPKPFTHQGAGWVEGSEAWKGTIWLGTTGEHEGLAAAFDTAASWGRRNARPMNLGEFGAYKVGDMASRARWTSAVVQEAESRGFSWTYWEFCSEFGAYDPIAGVWRESLLQALKSKR